MTWSRRNCYDSPETRGVRSLRRAPHYKVPGIAVDLNFDAAVIDSLVRGFPIGLVTILRAHDGQKVVEVVVDGARRLSAIQRHVFEEDGGLFLDFVENEVARDNADRLFTWPTSILGDELALWNVQQSIGRGAMANRVESVRNAVMGGYVIVQTVILDDVAALARRLGQEDRVEWLLAQTGTKPVAQGLPVA